MFEARLIHGCLFKNILESLKDLFNSALLYCNEAGISLQVMDPSHVVVAFVTLKSEEFDYLRYFFILQINGKFLK